MTTGRVTTAPASAPPASPPPVTAAISASGQRDHARTAVRSRRGSQAARSTVAVVERVHDARDLLALLVALAGDERRCRRPARSATAVRDRRAPVGDLDDDLAPPAAAAARAPASTAARIAAGSSERGLSSVTTTTSAAARRRPRPSAGAWRGRGRRRQPSTTTSRAGACRAAARAAPRHGVGRVRVVDDGQRRAGPARRPAPSGRAPAARRRAPARPARRRRPRVEQHRRAPPAALATLNSPGSGLRSSIGRRRAATRERAAAVAPARASARDQSAAGRRRRRHVVTGTAGQAAASRRPHSSSTHDDAATGPLGREQRAPWPRSSPPSSAWKSRWSWERLVKPATSKTTPSTRCRASAWLETSIAHTVDAALDHDGEQRLQVGRLGGRAHARRSRSSPTPGLDGADQPGARGRPRAAPASSRYAVVVLPLVPVTPSSQQLRRRVAVDPRREPRPGRPAGRGRRRTGRPLRRRARPPAGSVSTATAPARAASAANRAVRCGARAARRTGRRARTARESGVTPVTDRRRSAVRRGPAPSRTEAPRARGPGGRHGRARPGGRPPADRHGCARLPVTRVRPDLGGFVPRSAGSSAGLQARRP